MIVTAVILAVAVLVGLAITSLSIVIAVVSVEN